MRLPPLLGPLFYEELNRLGRRNSAFLLRAGFEQIQGAFALVMGKAGLDLYKKK